MFDTHCHLNFSAFEKRVNEVIKDANNTGVDLIVIPGTDIESSNKAVEIAQKYDGVYAAVGIHPHHIFEFISEKSIKTGPVGSFPPASARSNASLRAVGNPSSSATHDPIDFKFFLASTILKLQELFLNKKVVAVGEVGIDRHYYTSTKYKDYKIDETFIDLQKEFLAAQVKLAIKYDKSLILHSREAKKDLLEVLAEVWDKKLEGRTVFHCCEPDQDLLNYAKQHTIFIGVDGDVTYCKDKQEFVKKIPLEMLVLETDSPFLTPDPIRKQKKFPNEPKNLKYTTELIASVMDVSIDRLIDITTRNAKKLFAI